MAFLKKMAELVSGTADKLEQKLATPEMQKKIKVSEATVKRASERANVVIREIIEREKVYTTTADPEGRLLAGQNLRRSLEAELKAGRRKVRMMPGWGLMNIVLAPGHELLLWTPQVQAEPTGFGRLYTHSSLSTVKALRGTLRVDTYAPTEQGHVARAVDYEGMYKAYPTAADQGDSLTPVLGDHPFEDSYEIALNGSQLLTPGQTLSLSLFPVQMVGSGAGVALQSLLGPSVLAYGMMYAERGMPKPRYNIDSDRLVGQALSALDTLSKDDWASLAQHTTTTVNI